MQVVMPVRKRDNLWILSKYGVQRDWINAENEEYGIWPIHAPHSNLQCAFVCERFDVVENAAIKAIKDCKVAKKRMSVFIKPRVSLTLNVASDMSSVSSLFPDNLEVIDASNALKRLGMCTFRFIASVKFCTVRLDDSQHMMFAVDDDMNIIWRGKTVEEDYVHTRMHNNENTLALYVRRSAFVFDHRENTVSLWFRNRIRRQLLVIFYRHFSVDIIEMIAKMVISDVQVTSREFRQGACESVFSYGTARLLRVGWLLAESSLSLHEYYTSSDSCKKQVYALLKSIYRRRQIIFDRQPVSRVLRSGILY